MKTTELLSRIQLFQELTPKDLRHLADHTERRTFARNEIIFNAGDTGNDLHMIEKGRVEIFIPQRKQGKKLILATLTAGQFFGELSLFDRKPRSATACASESSEILVLKQETVLSYIKDHPEAAVAILAEMSERLRQTNERLNRQMSRNVYDEIDRKTTLSDRIADKVASFGGSWKFILSFIGFVVVWMVINVAQWLVKPFDNYPYQFLNLVLAVVASLQAPFIMMSQNRQSDKDRLSAKIDYEVNLKNEVGIETALQKIEAMGRTLAEFERKVEGKKPAARKR
jgi:CRP/FNR family cyclic AMP-dependent transcriptional regulator